MDNEDPSGMSWLSRAWNAVKSVARVVVRAAVMVVRAAVTVARAVVLPAKSVTQRTTVNTNRQTVPTGNSPTYTNASAELITGNVPNAALSGVELSASSVDPASVPGAFRGEPDSTIHFPNGSWRHFGDNGVADQDYHSTDHGYPKYHPHDKDGGHYQDWDYDENGKPIKGKPYLTGDDGEKDYDVTRDDCEKNKQDFSWVPSVAGLVVIVILFLLGLYYLIPFTAPMFA